MDTAKKRYSSSSSLHELSKGVVVRYALRSSNAYWHLSTYSNAFLNTLKYGKHLSIAFETNLLNAATCLVRLCISLAVFNDSIFCIAWILLGLASIPLCETMNLRNFPNKISKAHLLGFSFMLYHLSVLEVSWRSSRCNVSFALLTSILSTYTFHPIYGRNI